jgi:hypothetical protein
MSGPGLSSADREQLAAEGIRHEEAERQLALLREPPPPARLVRPCTVGDGIERLSPERQEELLRLGATARRAGRLLKFVPASGAATRMFSTLAAVRRRLPTATAAEWRTLAEAGSADALAVARFVDALPRLALGDAWAAHLGVAPEELQKRLAREPLGTWLAALLDDDGFAAATAPKALLPFHRAPEGPRSAFTEQLHEGLTYLVDDELVARFHFTVAPGAEPAFERELAAARERIGALPRLEVGFSAQARSTHTLALDARGEPAREADGRLLLRPAGHGALLGNLEATGGDLVLIKNIDNVLPAPRHAEIGRWKTILVGRLLELVADSARGAAPARVVGVVPAAGEPGGGPFWLAGDDGEHSAQIVEGVQVDLGDSSQAAIWNASTHFNPVDLAVALSDAAGVPYRLAELVDPAASLVAQKSEGGRELTVLERPGLWNGGMAGWETVFVEVPSWTFAPVKTVLDLTRDEHLAG